MQTTQLDGNKFLNCWWDAVKCDSLFIHGLNTILTAIEGHLALWQNAVHHCDVGASNLMCKDEGGVVVGIPNDFDDLATTEEYVMRNEPTDTDPFMAMELLPEEGFAG